MPPRTKSIDAAAIIAAVDAALDAEGAVRRLSVAIVDDATIHRINRDFLEHDWATDVIAFELDDDLPGVDGEIVVSAETAVREAKSRGVPWHSELLLYCVHGTLHLLGHDDHEPAAKRRMQKRQVEILRKLGHEIDS